MLCKCAQKWAQKKGKAQKPLAWQEQNRHNRVSKIPSHVQNYKHEYKEGPHRQFITYKQTIKQK